MSLLMIGAAVSWFVSHGEQAVESAQQDRAAAMAEKAEKARVAMAKLAVQAKENPVPSDWRREGSRGASVLLPPGAEASEVISPVGELAFQILGTDDSSAADFQMFAMPLQPEAEVKRDQWLRNIFQYSGGEAEELFPVQRSGIDGVRIRLNKRGELLDPVMEVFVQRDSMIIFVVFPSGSARTNIVASARKPVVASEMPKHAEAFFASIELPKASGASQSPTDLIASSSEPAPPAEKLTPAEARRKALYLEYRKFAGANSQRSALPGVSARDSIDGLMKSINKQQVQSFMAINNLNQKQLDELIREGNERRWAE